MTQLKIIRNRKIRVGIVGCGRISKNHIKAIGMHPKQAEIVALCDKNIEALNKARDEVNKFCVKDNELKLFAIEGKFKTVKDGKWIYLEADKGNYFQDNNFIELQLSLIHI